MRLMACESLGKCIRKRIHASSRLMPNNLHVRGLHGPYLYPMWIQCKLRPIHTRRESLYL